jgi:hypothetical protein
MSRQIELSVEKAQGGHGMPLRGICFFTAKRGLNYD